MQLFLDGKRLLRSQVVDILTKGEEILRAEPTIINATSSRKHSFNVVGDLHGQFYDLIGGVFRTCGEPSATNSFCFNGGM